MLLTVLAKSSADQSSVTTFSGEYDVEALERVTHVEVGSRIVPVARQTILLGGDGTLRCELLLDDRVFWLERVNQSHPEIARLIAVALVFLALAMMAFAVWLLILADTDQSLSVLGYAYWEGAWLIGLLGVVTIFAVQSLVDKRYGSTATVAVGMFLTVIGLVAIGAWNSFAIDVTRPPDWPAGYKALAEHLNQSLTPLGAKLLVLGPPLVAILQLFSYSRLAEFLKAVTPKAEKA